MRTLLLLDDETAVLSALQRALRQAYPGGLTIETFTDPEQALLRCAEHTFDVVVSDYRMPGLTGADFFQMAKGIQPDAVRIVLSASTDSAEIMGAINRGEVFRYLSKPWQTEDLRATLDLAFVRRDENLAARRRLDEEALRRGELTPQEAEARRLEREEPGITKVRRGPDGSVYFD
jgi:DNA-binding NtrC family response regulator